MRKKYTWSLFSAFLLVFLVIISGCELILPPTTYEASPTRISYELSYGYSINSTGNGIFEIIYWCDTPEILRGTTRYTLLYDQEYETKTVLNNTFIHWNISARDERTFQLGITATVEAATYYITDLNGENALTLIELREDHTKIMNQYTRLQANETIRFIDPSDPEIVFIANAVLQNIQSNNTFVVAKALFSWLKQNVEYNTHPDEKTVRSAAVTLENRQGDCDDLSFLYISLCRAVGIPARFIRGFLLTEAPPGTVTAVAHAWVEVFVGTSDSLSGWIPVECACCSNSIETDINQNFGVESAFHLRLFTDDGSNESLSSSLSGISYVTHQPNMDIELRSFAESKKYKELESKKLIVTDKNIRYYE